MNHLKYLNKFFLKYKNKIFTGFVFVVLANVLALLPANLIGKSFNLIVNSLNKNNVSLSLNLSESSSEMGMTISYDINQTINSNRIW